MSYPMTSAFTDMLRYGTFLVDARLTVFKKGKRVTTIILPVSTIRITMDRNSTFRCQGTIAVEVVPTVPPPPYLPVTPAGLLSPMENEIYVETRLLSKTTNADRYVPLGLFSIDTTKTDDTGVDLLVTVHVYTRAWRIGQNLFQKAYTVPAATGTLAGELEHLLTLAWDTPTAPLTFGGIMKTGATLKVPAQSFTQGTSPWTAAQQLALSVGYEVWITSATIVRPTTTAPPTSIKPIVMARRVPTGFLGHITVTGVTKTITTWLPTKSAGVQQPSWFFTTTKTLVYGSGTGQGDSALYGDQYTVPVGTQIQMTTTGVYNQVIMTGASPATAPGATNATGTAAANTKPIVAVATTPKAETTRVRPEFVSTSYITSVTGARQAAISHLAQSLADAWQVTVTTAPNPTLRINDIISITRPRLGLNQAIAIVDTITHTVSFSTLTTITGRIIKNNTTRWSVPKGS